MKRVKPVIRFSLHRREEGDWVVAFEQSKGINPIGDHAFRYVAMNTLPSWAAVLRWLTKWVRSGAATGRA